MLLLSYLWDCRKHLGAETQPHQFEIGKCVLDENVHALCRSHPKLCRERVRQELVVFVVGVVGVHQELLDR